MNYRERYIAYLQTEHWSILRKEVFALLGEICFCCGSDILVEPHHIIYRELYDCVPDDLMPLCHDCHELCHSAKRDNLEIYKEVTHLPPDFRRKAIVSLIKAQCHALHQDAPGKGPIAKKIELNHVRLIPNQKRPFRSWDYTTYCQHRFVKP